MFKIFMLSFLTFVNTDFEMIPERSNLTYINNKYLTLIKYGTYRNNRRGPYYVDVVAQIKQTWGDNITMHAVFYEFFHNTYKRSFFEVHEKCCNCFKEGNWIGKAVKKHFKNMSCPLEPGLYKFEGIPFLEVGFPNVFPFQKCKVKFHGVQHPTKDKVYEGFVDLIVKNRAINNKS